MFAKLFDRPLYGQVLVVFDSNDEGKPELRWSVKPPGLGVCSLAFGFKDTDAGWEAAEKALADADDAAADKHAHAVFSQLGISTTPTQAAQENKS